jgi:hypothetical protein
MEDEGPGNYSSLYSTAPPCPLQPGPPGSASRETPAQLARRHWEDLVPLPKPDPRILPGRAITGLRAYLETRGKLTHNYRSDTVFGPLVIDAKAQYEITWGDDTPTETYGFEGGPWPEGQITHQYERVGKYDVTVTERWTATWSIAGQSGVLRTLRTIGQIDDFPVEQIQAVIRQ